MPLPLSAEKYRVISWTSPQSSWKSGKLLVSGGGGGTPSRQVDVYSIKEGRDAAGRNIGLNSEAEIRDNIRRALKAQAAPKPQPKVVEVSVPRVQHECTKRFLAELKITFPAAGLFSKESKPVSMGDLSFVVT